MHLESCLKASAEEETEISTSPRVMHHNLSIDDKELEAIMLREFGPISRRQYSSAKEYSAPSAHSAYRKKTNYLIVDGYNLIFCWDELAELGREKVDIIRYSDNLPEYVAEALSPAKVISVEMEEERSCRVTVSPDQLSLAIGKEGQNAKLVARLTGCKIDIKA